MLPRGNALLPLIIVLAATGSGSALDSHPPFPHNRDAQGVNFWKLHRTASISKQQHRPTQDWAGVSQIPLAAAAAVPEFHVETFTQPLDHFYNTTDATFPQRFWVNTRHYKPRPGAPVIVIDGGETNGEDRLPFLNTGIADILARATGGVGVVLEHRYYGKSIGVQNFSTDALRWLNNEQALEDSANFMRKVKFQDIDEDLTAPNTPWIYYGGSYAGARAAHMRVLTLTLSVTHAVLTNWEYMDVIRLAADAKCSSNLVNSVSTIDRVLKFRHLRGPLKKLFGLDGLESDQDFVSVLTYPLASWQDRNWDPAVGSTTFDHFCATLNGDASTLEDAARSVVLPGPLRTNVALLNYAKWIRENVVDKFCPQDASLTLEDCFGTNNDEKYQATDLSQYWRLWVFQFCTQWGYLTHYRVPALPNVTAVNALGDYHIAADRLAFIDGEVDPWRPYTPHSNYGGAVERDDTLLRPFKIIPGTLTHRKGSFPFEIFFSGGVHHWDENGLGDGEREPKEIREIHEEMIEFVKVWLKDWEGPVTKAS
ncbi:serine carboxypeptidase S28-domain-containing protein [Russula vinacea]|nr:serine carboxypeptidase S28-domain-containing protein [Russula vinacea]